MQTQTPVIVQMMQNSIGFYFYLYAKDFTFASRGNENPDLEKVIPQVEATAARFSLKVVDRLPVFDHTGKRISIWLGRDPGIHSDLKDEEFQKKIEDYNKTLIAAYNKL